MDRKLAIRDGGQPPGVHEKHGALVQLCSGFNEVSKYVDRILEQKYRPYERVIGGVNPESICRFIEGESGFDEIKGVPLDALIWFVARSHHEEIKQIEVRVFHAVHMKDHQAMRFYDSLGRLLPGDMAPENVVEELRRVQAGKVEAERRIEKSERKKEQLRSEIEALKGQNSELACALAEQRRRNDDLEGVLQRTGAPSLLEELDNLRREKELLAQEIDILAHDLLRQGPCDPPSRISDAGHSQRKEVEVESAIAGTIEDSDNGLPSLTGMKVAFVGGVESLVPHYRQIVEQLDGVFISHCGECQTKGEVEGIIGGADVVFCPTGINSHGACRLVKNVCKNTGKPSYFLRSAGLSTFRKELIELARNTQS